MFILMQRNILSVAFRQPKFTELENKEYFDSLLSFKEGNPDYNKSIVQQIGYNEFCKERQKIVLFAEQRHCFLDFFPKDLRMIKARINVTSDKLLKVGDLVTPSSWIQRPEFKVQTFHKEKVLYTFLCVDGDKVRPETMTRSEEILWMVSNISLNATTTEIMGKEVLSYIPPHPTRGSKKHRICLFLFEQTKEFDSKVERNSLLWDLIKFNSFIPRGLNIFHMEWDESVQNTFHTFFNRKEPIYRDQQRLKKTARNVYRKIN